MAGHKDSPHFHHQLADAVVESVVNDAFPETDELAVAPLSGALPEILRALQESSTHVTSRIIEKSRTKSSEIDSWIHHSQKLRDDVAHTKKLGLEILERHKQTAALKEARDNAVAHGRFLSNEVRFSQSLVEILRAIKSVASGLDRVAEELNRGDMHIAVNLFYEAEGELGNLDTWEDTFVVHLIRNRCDEVRKTVLATVERRWKELISVNVAERTVRIYRAASQNTSAGKLGEALKRLGKFDSEVDALHLRIDEAIVDSVLPTAGGAFREFHVDDSEGDYATIKAVDSSSNSTSGNLLSSLKVMLSFFQRSLPQSVWTPLSAIFLPSLCSNLVSKWLPEFVPTELSRISDFESLLKEADEFNQFLSTLGANVTPELSDWVSRAGRVWLAKKRTHTLNDIRLRVVNGVTKERVLERVVENSPDKSELLENFDDAWDNNWDSDNDGDKHPTKDEQSGSKLEKSAALKEIDSKDEEDVSGWGLDVDIEDDVELNDGGEGIKEPTDAEDEWDAWGIDDDGDTTGDTTQTNVNDTKPSIATTTIGKAQSKVTEKKGPEIETYVATEVPRATFELVQQIILEAEELKTNPKFKETPIANSSAGLLSIPSQILASYRALAPIYYKSSPSMQMILFNDVALLISLLKGLDSNSIATSIPSLELLCTRTYESAIQQQKTVVLDLIDSAQGFVGCSESPQRDVCFDAIGSMVAQAKEIEKEWKAVLPQSIFKQAFVYDLLESIAEKIVNDVEDIEDIAEEESNILSSLLQTVAFSFEHISPKGKYMKKLSALAKILEATMAEILEMMAKGEADGFGEDEMKDLIRALFAESDLRRHVLGEVEKWARARY